jgi:hypothetical protein
MIKIGENFKDDKYLGMEEVFIFDMAQWSCYGVHVLCKKHIINN